MVNKWHFYTNTMDANQMQLIIIYLDGVTGTNIIISTNLPKRNHSLGLSM